MEDQEKDKKPKVEVINGMTFTTNDELKKYLAPEYEPPKLKGIREKFKNGINIKR